MKLGYFSDEMGWGKLFEETMLNLYQSKYGKNISVQEKSRFDAFIKSPNLRSDFAREMRLDRRSIDFARNIAILYCEAIRRKIDLYVTTGVAHVYGTQRLLKKYAPDLDIVTDFTPGALKVMQDDEKLSDN